MKEPSSDAVALLILLSSSDMALLLSSSDEDLREIQNVKRLLFQSSWILSLLIATLTTVCACCT